MEWVNIVHTFTKYASTALLKYLFVSKSEFYFSGKRFAIMMFHVLAVNILKRYRLEYAGTEAIRLVLGMSSRPDRPVDIRFIKRTE